MIIFLKIVSCHYKNHNNSYFLEKNLNWSGIMNEIEPYFLESYKTYRKNSNYVIEDARKVNFAEVLKKYKLPQNIDYLQLDLDANNRSTLDVLENFNRDVFDNYKFATVTFEHDIYTGNHHNTRVISRQILKDRGYILVFPDVYIPNYHTPSGPIQAIFEDWYVHPDLINLDYISKIKQENSMNFVDIISHLEKVQKTI